MVIAALLAVQTHYNAKSRSYLASPGDKSLSSTDSMNIQLFCLCASIAQRVRDPRKPRECSCFGYGMAGYDNSCDVATRRSSEIASTPTR